MSDADGCGVVITTSSAFGRPGPRKSPYRRYPEPSQAAARRLAPPHIRKELFERTLQSRPSPKDRTIGAREHADGNQFHPPSGDGHEHTIQIGGLRMHAEQSRQREPVDVGVNGGRIITERRESGGKIRGDGRFADTAFAGCYGENTGFDARLIKGVLLAIGFETCNELGELVLAHGSDFDTRQQRRIRVGCHRSVDLVGDGLR